MEAMEIILLIAGMVVFVLSFIIPAKREEMSAETKEAVRKEIEAVIAADVEAAKGKIGDIVEETVEYSIEKTERMLERVSNEKIMAVSEYADTVLGDINKNHTEVMFLYDILNEKQQSIKETVSEVAQTVKRAERAADEAITADLIKEEGQKAEGPKADSVPEVSAKKGTHAKQAEAMVAQAKKKDFDSVFQENMDGNNNDKILELHKQGKTNVEIAKELGLGVGEVKLVIGLFEGI